MELPTTAIYSYMYDTVNAKLIEIKFSEAHEYFFELLYMELLILKILQIITICRHN
jgi:hypothetical protein